MQLRTLAVALTIVGLAGKLALSADRLILRNLDVVSDRTVKAFDEDGLVLDSGKPGGQSRITWDQVERGRVALDEAGFDKQLAELGPPLYRIRQRLSIGDYEAVGEPAELLYPRFVERKSQTAYMVCQATMWSRLANGKREAALEPYLRCYELLRSQAASADLLLGSRRLPIDRVTAITPDLLPVWFEAAAAKSALPGVQNAIRTLAQPRPQGVFVYYASLAIAAGDASEAERVLPLVSSDEASLSAWRDVLLAQQELAAGGAGPAIDRLRRRLDELPDLCRPVALLLCGLVDAGGSSESVREDGLLNLLALPAMYGRQQPDLAAAGLYHAATALDKLKEGASAAAVRRELTTAYPTTHFGVMIANKTKR